MNTASRLVEKKPIFGIQKYLFNAFLLVISIESHHFFAEERRQLGVGHIFRRQGFKMIRLSRRSWGCKFGKKRITARPQVIALFDCALLSYVGVMQLMVYS